MERSFHFRSVHTLPGTNALRWSIRNQILLPFAATLVVSVMTIAVSAATLSAWRSERERSERLSQVVDTLRTTRFPISDLVLQKMSGLSGAEFVAVDPRNNCQATSLERTDDLQSFVRQALDHQPDGRLVRFDERDWWLSRVEQQYLPGHRLLVLYPDAARRELFWSAVRPPLWIGGATLVVMLGVSVWLAGRFGQRIHTVRTLFRKLEQGEFPRASEPDVPDELGDLIASANHLSAQLERMQLEMRRTERLRLVAQLAGGLAHQLRNSVTGVRLAIQLHQRRHPDHSDSETLERALEQLRWTEQHVQRLLTVGDCEQRHRQPARLVEVIADIDSFASSCCAHARVHWLVSGAVDHPGVIQDAAGVRTALLNLILNGVEAAGSGGEVELNVSEAIGGRLHLRVSDTGPGPPAELAEQLFDPFVTSKPDGIGLGLVSSRQLLRSLGGDLTWSRTGDRTIFDACFQLQPEPRRPSLPDQSSSASCPMPVDPAVMGSTGELNR